ncbi:METTL5 family protein [Candidatus Woesearchaeota archaeon]|nr:METTL5 family protein [Candidatus Woesearchaeota archaeon]
MMQKSRLSIQLSKLKSFEKPDVKLEQYSTPGEIAADVLWNANMIDNIENKSVADFACGPGILGIGCLLLGAKKAYFVDKSKEALDIAKQNVPEEFIAKCEFIESDINEIELEADIVVQNPPFGTKEKHADKMFLEKAFKTAPVIYSIHKITSKDFIDAVAKDFGYKVTHIFPYNFPIKATMKFHKKPVRMIKAACWRLEKHL